MDKQKFSKLSAVDFSEIQRVEKEKFIKIDKGILPHRLFKKPVTLKILMLVDTGISYNRFYFGLSEVLNTLYTNPEWWVNFDITKAHRFSDPNPPQRGTNAFDLYGPDFENFRFNQGGFDLNDYDQLWIFGFNSSATFPQALNDDELEIVYQWMNEKQGGILAMGDHARLGASLCSEIPRVRNMRKWRNDVPNNFGPDRHDTLYKGRDDLSTAVNEAERYTFDDESDDIPMRISPKWYYSHLCVHEFKPKNFLWPYKWKKSPHPILCGKEGVINVLPDHPHEGEVVEPKDLNDILSFNAYSFEEYPKVGNRRLKPEVIAWASVQDDHTNTNSFKRAANPKRFGAIGAYNGHCADVGRVVVDSTWHHWFDVNLNGRLVFGTGNAANVSDARKLNGFNDTPQGQAAYEKIKNYFRNVAIWLAPPKKQKQMACVAMWNSLFRYPLFADFSPELPVWELGHNAINVLGKYAGQCNVKRWWPLFIPEFRFEKLFDERRAKVPNFQLENIDEFLIGGIFKSMLQQKEDLLMKKIEQPSDKDLDKMVTLGLKLGLDDFQSLIRQKELSERNIKQSLKELSTLIP